MGTARATSPAGPAIGTRVGLPRRQERAHAWQRFRKNAEARWIWGLQMGGTTTRRSLFLVTMAMLATVTHTGPAMASGGNAVVSPRPMANVARGSIPVRVHVSAGLVGTKAGILTVPGWSLRLGGQPRGSLDYNLFRIQSQPFTVRAPAPRHLGRYTIRINRDSSGDHSAIAQVRVTFRSFDVGRPHATPQTFYP